MAPRNANEHSVDSANNSILTDQTGNNKVLTSGSTNKESGHDRRSFLKATGAIGGIAAGIPGAASAEDIQSESDASELPNTLTVRGTGTPTNYRFEVTRQVGVIDNFAEEDDTIVGSTVEGSVTTSEHVDKFGFSGELSALELLTGEAEVRVNGSVVDVENASGSESRRTLKVQGTGTPTQYYIEVNKLLTSVEDTVESNEKMSETSVTGSVTESEDVDRYTFYGEITTLEVSDGGADVYVDGQLVGSTDRNTDESTSESSRSLQVQGRGTTTQYHIEVSDVLTPVEDTVESYEAVSEASVTGWITEPEHVDRFTFTGEISEISFYDGEADVYVDGQRVTPDNPTTEPTRRLKVQGTGTATQYHIEVDDSLVGVNDSMESYEEVSSTSVTGWVTDPEHVDEFIFTGSVNTVKFYIGEANVYVDGQLIGGR